MFTVEDHQVTRLPFGTRGVHIALLRELCFTEMRKSAFIGACPSYQPAPHELNIS